MYEELTRFFTLPAIPKPLVFYYGNYREEFEKGCSRQGVEVSENPANFHQYAIIDLRHVVSQIENLDIWREKRQEVFNMCKKLFLNHQDRRFITIIAQNKIMKGAYEQFAWDLGYIGASIFSLKDEKIACSGTSKLWSKINPSNAGDSNFYVLNFRKDELSQNSEELLEYQFVSRKAEFTQRVPSWFILKPQRRNSDEILHPAKYPEDLIEMYVTANTKKGDNVYDPMSGTGSSQVGALRLGRNGYGTELSTYFGQIARKRCQEVIAPSQESLFPEKIDAVFRIELGDAFDFRSYKFPNQQYLITSPPYWDMLNMKGAENQAKRIQSGLRTNYSDDNQDMGNVSDYKTFVHLITKLYVDLVELMDSGSKVTIVVKNIKKKGSNYPLAWDLCRELQNHFHILPEDFWLQDDISIAPFGYGNTWVSNTFHQYCLQLQVP